MNSTAVIDVFFLSVGDVDGAELVEALGDEFRRGVGDPGGHAGFGAGEVLDLVGGAAEGEEERTDADGYDQ